MIAVAEIMEVIVVVAVVLIVKGTVAGAVVVVTAVARQWMQIVAHDALCVEGERE